MSSNNKYFSIWICACLFGVYLILKWTCKLIFGLLDYAIFFFLIIGVVRYLTMPTPRRKAINQKIKSILGLQNL